MSEQILQEEKKYLKNTLAVIGEEIEKEAALLASRRKELVSTGRDMWENTVHFSTDFEKLTEVVQYLTTLNTQTVSYDMVKRQLERLKKMLDAPYFGRFDFEEEGFGGTEKIYIGLSSLIDSKTKDILVYDWRAPISGIFYEYQLGKAAYKAPKGRIQGEVTLKRQYRISKGQLDYYFDSSLKIDDEVLQEALSRNASSKMRNIVESIQKEQNIVIRDTENELLIVQGAAGSGKTSVALHRIAFLLYQGMEDQLSSSNIIILSPNELFSRYISRVLPELGEDNVRQLTFEEVLRDGFGEALNFQSRSEMLEELTLHEDEQALEKRICRMAFKGSRDFARLLDRLIDHYLLKLVEFEDIYYDGRVIETRQQLRSMLLNQRKTMPIAKRMEWLRRIVFERIAPLRKARLQKLEAFVQGLEGHEFDIKPFSRLLSIKETKGLSKRMEAFTRIDYLEVYKALFCERGLLQKLAQGLSSPVQLEEMARDTASALKSGRIPYEDCAPLLYLKLCLEGGLLYPDIRQVVVDEAQDYSPLHYEIFNLLFKHSRFTVLGDVNQSIEKERSRALYDLAAKILNKKKSLGLQMDKSYRSTCEINRFAQKIYGTQQESISFDREGREPEVRGFEDTATMDEAIIETLKLLQQEGYETLAVLCKNAKEARTLYNRIGGRMEITLVTQETQETGADIIIIPAYLAKGLEFDAVLGYNISEDNYSRELDRRLLYIICTRALHRLDLLYTGRPSCFIQ